MERRQRQKKHLGGRKLSRSKIILFSVLPAALLFLVAELMIRLLGLGVPDEAGATTWSGKTRFTEVRLTSPDGRKSTYRDGAVVLGVPIRLNELGYRGWLYHEHNPKHAVRIAAVGDSFTFGDGLLPEETWPAQLAVRLEGVPWVRRPIQVMNFGRRGANTTE